MAGSAFGSSRPTCPAPSCRWGLNVGSRRSILGIALCAALVFAGLDWTRKNVEVVTLQVMRGSTDHYAQVFIVDDPPAVWVRAERPDRLWLESLRSNPEVVVHRRDSDFAYHAEVWNGEGGHERIDELFRAKYGAFDRVAAWISRRDAVPIRLEPGSEFASDF